MIVLFYTTTEFSFGAASHIIPIPAAGTTVAGLPTSDFKDEFLPNMVRFMIYGMGTVSLVVFLAAGVLLVLSWGEEEMTTKAKDMIVWGVAGIAATAASYAVVKGVLGFDFGLTV